MINILFLAYYFPPQGGGGVQRTIKFLKYLPSFGFRPIIVTGFSTGCNQWTPADRTLVQELSPEAQIYRIRVPYKEPPKTVARLERLVPVRNTFRRWWYTNCVNIIRDILLEENIRLMYCSMSPFDSAQVGDYFLRKYRVPWVADLRDPWALDEMQIYPSLLHKKFELRKMKRLLEGASGIIMNTPEAEKRLRRAFPEFRNRKIISITNGYDDEDFAPSPEEGIHEKFTIVHTGHLHTQMGQLLGKRNMWYRITGGATPGLDILTRSHLFLLKALKKWVEFLPEIARKIKVVLAGVISEGDKRIVQESGISRLVRLPGYLPHSASVSLTKRADLLFLPMHNLPDGVRATIVPGKTYEYMATGNPILAAVPEGDAKDFLQQCGTAFICRPNDVRGMIEIMEKTFQAWLRGEKIVEPNWPFIKQFTRKRLTARLAEFLDSVLEAERAKSRTGGQ